VSHATHANAALTPRARLRLGQLVVDHGWPVARAAERYDVSWKTAHKWAQRYRLEGAAGMMDRSSAPHRQARRTPSRVVRRIVSLRRRHRLGPVAIADLLGIPASTVHAVLVRCRLKVRSRGAAWAHPPSTATPVARRGIPTRSPQTTAAVGALDANTVPRMGFEPLPTAGSGV
jgi:hypothetical protein